MSVQGYQPRTGEPNGAPVPDTSGSELAATTARAAAAAAPWREFGAAGRAAALDAVADALDAACDELAALADTETALGLPRLRGEVTRTTGQLRLFGRVLREGSWLEAVLDSADPDATPPRPALARMLVPIGPVAVYAASNFPFAFSVAGGDTASALAAGCPVVVKAHPGHPATSVRTAGVVRAALDAAGAPQGVFDLVHGFDAGVALVTDPAVRAAGFTGSLAGGRALFDLAAGRDDPIPFYGELGSVNPVVVLPEAAAADPDALAAGYVSSLTLGAGQFCTNPGLLFVPAGADALRQAIAARLAETSGAPMLTARMADAYREHLARWDAEASTTPLAAGKGGEGPWAPAPRLFGVTLAEFVAHQDELAAECFGPAGLVVGYDSVDALLPVLTSLRGNLTGSVHAAPTEHADAARVAAVFERTTGRVLFNGWPTGVAVTWSMQHGGPWPATTAAAHTSVGATAIRRWLIPVCYQGWPDELLPAELRAANPLGIPRREDGVLVATPSTP